MYFALTLIHWEAKNVSYLKFNIEDELAKAVRGEKTSADGLTLLSIILAENAFKRFLKAEAHSRRLKQKRLSN
jgi:hypothetical protein